MTTRVHLLEYVQDVGEPEVNVDLDDDRAAELVEAGVAAYVEDEP